MSRYKSTRIKQRLDEKTGKNREVYFGTTYYNNVPEKNDDMYFIAQEGDRCDALASRFYQDPSLWWFIARVNNLTANNIPAGTSIRIPVSTENAKGF